MELNRRDFLQYAIGATASTMFFPWDIEAQSETPNIILVMADDHGWGDVGFNGHPTIKTPHLDAMAKNGMRLNRFYAAAPLCSPTRGSCLTGRYPWRFGILAAHTGGMRQAEITVAEIAKTKGYQTGFFGKWHLGWVKPDDDLTRGHYSPPEQHGFDESFATTSAVPTWNPTITPDSWQQSNQNRPGQPWKGGMPYVHNGVEVSDNMSGDDSRIIMDRAVPFIQNAVSKKKPFLSCIWFHTPHEPVVAGPEHRNMYAHLDEEKQHYYGSLTAMDEQIGRLRQTLRDLNIEKNTIVFFCSDNGPSGGATRKGVASAGPFKGHKHTMYEGGLRVPAVVEWPGHIAPNSASDAMCGTVDYFPTIAELLEDRTIEKKPRPIDGISLLPILKGAQTTRANPMFFGYRRLYQGIDGQALIDNQYKLLKRAKKDGGFELYDLQNDPAESHDLTKEKPELFAKMKAQMAEQDASCQRSRDGADYIY